jgi:hypothetical protein
MYVSVDENMAKGLKEPNPAFFLGTMAHILSSFVVTLYKHSYSDYLWILFVFYE